MDKVQFNYRIDSNIVEEWRKLVVLNEGYAYRFLCGRLEKILKADIIALRTTTQRTSSKVKITKQDVIEVKNKIIEWMITPGSNPNRPNTALYEGEGDSKCIVEKHLREAIKIVAGKLDDRTVGNWIKRLEVYRCIRNNGARLFEFLPDGVEDVQKELTPMPKQRNLDAEKEASDVFKKLGI